MKKALARAYVAALSDMDLSTSDDSSSSDEEVEMPKSKGKGKHQDFTGLCFMTNSGTHDNDSDSDSATSEVETLESLTFKVDKLEDVVLRQDKLLCEALRENKGLKAKVESSHVELASLRSLHNDMSAEECASCAVVMDDLVKLKEVHARVASQLEGAQKELDELKAKSIPSGVCDLCPRLVLEIIRRSLKARHLESKLNNSSRYTVVSPPCTVCVSLKGKLFNAVKENNELTQEVEYLSARLERNTQSEKLVEEDLSRVEESFTRTNHKLGLGFERCEKSESPTKFVRSSTYQIEEKTIKPKTIAYAPNPKPSFNPKKPKAQSSMPKTKRDFICMFCGREGHLDDFCFRRKRIERRQMALTRNTRHDEFEFSSSRFASRASRGYGHPSYGYNSRESGYMPRLHGYDPRSHRGVRPMQRRGFPQESSYHHFGPRRFDGSRFPHRGNHPARPNGDVHRTVVTSSGQVLKCWIPKSLLTNPSTKPSTFSSHRV